MTMADPKPRQGTAQHRIWEAISGLPTNPDGYVYFRPSALNEAVGAGLSATNAALSQWERSGQVTILREANRVVGVRMPGWDVRGSQTTRVLHLLTAYASPKGKVALTIEDIHHKVAARDQHDTVKALHDLKKLGLLTFRVARDSGIDKVRDIRVNDPAAAYSGLPVPDEKPLAATSMLAPFPPPGNYPNGTTTTQTFSTTTLPRAVETDPDVRDDLLPVEPAGEGPGDDEPIVYPAPAESMVPPSWSLYGIEMQFPDVFALLERRKHIEDAANLLGQAGPDYADEAVALLGRAETCYTPLEQQVIGLVRAITEGEGR